MDKSTSGKGSWTTAEIVYVSISGILICMAFAEIIAFTGSLSYSFVKVHQKARAAGQRGVQYLSLVVMVVFWTLRIIFLGAMLSLVPVPHWQGMSSYPSENHQFIPREIIVASQYVAFGLVFLLLVMPTVISIHQLATSPTNIKEQLDSIRASSTFPRVLIVMPVYNELPEVLHVAICSAIDGDYPKEHLHIFISFDNDAVSDLYRALIRNLGIPADGEFYPPVLDLYFRGVQITVSRFPHGGKRLTQKKTFGLINSIYKEYPDKTDHLFVLFIDSDILLHASTIANFVWDMQFRSSGNNDLLAMTGVITVTTKTDMTFINLLQDIEYVHGQFIGRAIESAVGGCVTLPGALTIFRYSAFLKCYDEYFAERSVSDLWDFGRSHLGEDRYLTHLLMAKAHRPKMIQFCHRATCKTEPVREWRNLMKQRRRWFLGFLTNEGAFLSDPQLWASYPWLLAFRLIQDIVNGTSMVSYVTIVAVATGMEHASLIWLGLLAAYFFLNWAMMFTYGLWLGRLKALFYPMMFIVGPFVTWFLLVYGVATANERTWGGPRADAATDKATTEESNGQNDGHEKDEEERAGFEDPHHEFDHGHGDYSDDEQIELPDHLFYPQQQEVSAAKMRRRQTFRESVGSTAVNIVHGLHLRGDELHSSVQEQSLRTLSKSESAACEITIVCNEVVISSGEEESDDSGDEDEGDLDALDQAYGDYFGSRIFGFASSPLQKPDTQWWDDDNHLSSLGILPYMQRPKIPAMFASVETLILTPIYGELPPSPATSHVSSSSSSSSVSCLRREGPGIITAPGTPRSGAADMASKPKSVHGASQPRPFASSTPSVPDMSIRGRRSASSPNLPKLRSRSAAPGSESPRGKQGAEIPFPSPALSIARPRRLSTSNTPSPQPSFHYIPAEYLTPSNSTPTTPKLSPLLLPSPQYSRSRNNSSSSFSSVPLPSPALSTSSTYVLGPKTPPLKGSHKVLADVNPSATTLLDTAANPNTPASPSRSQHRRRSSASSSHAKAFRLEYAAPPVPTIPSLSHF